MAADETLRKEITHLGRLFGEVLREFEGPEAFALVEQVRAEARKFREGDMAAGEQLEKLLPELSNKELRLIIGAFAGFLELANLAEDRQRIRSLRDRQLASHPNPRRESVSDAIHTLKEQGYSAEQVQKALDAVDVDLVFTAHPTEAKRRSLRSKLRALRKLLKRLDIQTLLPSEREETEQQLRREIVKLWQTNLIRPSRPTVLEEVRRGLSFRPVLWQMAPRILREVRGAVDAYYPGDDLQANGILRFGSWMGGDRDGNPFVTPEITEQTVLWMRQAAIEAHLKTAAALSDSLSMTCGEGQAELALTNSINAACEQWPALTEEIEPIAPRERYRQWIKIIRWRLSATAKLQLTGDWPDGAYHSADELAADLELMRAPLVASGNAEIAETELQAWLDQINTFGFHTARLDLRQHSEVYAGVMEEIWVASQCLDRSELPLSEEARCALIRKTLPVAANLEPIDLSDDAKRTLELFRVARRIARRFGMAALGGHVISMTRQPSDLLTVLWLWKWSERVDGGHPEGHAFDVELRLPIVPLFETIDDLKHATDILNGALNTPEYLNHVRAQGDRQMVMIGYSDSTKDGGYLAAAWGLQRGQIEIFHAAQEHGVQVTFFHGRGGSLGRGGGPAARAILSLPGETFDGSLRLTEQGEVLAERYDDPQVAHRHLEQVVWSVLMAATHDSGSELGQWRGVMDSLAETSFDVYRELVDHPSFVRFFRTATPISGVEQLPIGSRPSKRKGGDRIEDLRAIPWVFSWTQSRCLLPAWFGLGAAFDQLIEDDPQALEQLQGMYRNWRFFQATIDNSALAIAKANLPVFRRYVDLAVAQAEVTDPKAAKELQEIAQMVYDEYSHTRAAILAITQTDELLDDIPWLQRSIIVRNGYVDPLNFVQVEVMRRVGKLVDAGTDPESEQAQELQRLTLLAIKGVAAGMRTTG